MVPHSYHGANGDFEGPQCSKILENLDKLEPYLSDVEGIMYLNLLKSFQQVKNKVFGSVLGLDWEIALKDFAENLHFAHLCVGLPISPKLHVIATHVPQAIRQLGTALGRDNESSTEAAHSIFAKIWQFSKGNDVLSDVFAANLLKAVLRMNADNTRHFSN